MAAKKKPASAADFRKAEEASKKKPSIQTTATYKGQKVDWQTPKPVAGNTVGPAKSTLRSGGKLSEAQNIARGIAVGGPVIKSLVGKIVSGTAPKVTGSALTGKGTYTTPNPSVANSYSSASSSSLMGKGSYSGSANAAGSYSSIRGMNVSGKTVLQEDLGIPIAIGAVLSKKKKKK
jgi:hypothetical protein